MASGAGSWSHGRACAWGACCRVEESAQPRSRFAFRWGRLTEDAAAAAGPRALRVPGAAGTRGRGGGGTGADSAPRLGVSYHAGVLVFGGFPRGPQPPIEC